MPEKLDNHPENMSPLVHRLLRGIGANAYGQLVTIISQLGLIPIFLHYWSEERYGVWLMISAIPAYLSLADGGIASATGNLLTILRAKERYRSASKLFAQSLTIISIILGICLAAASFVILATAEISKQWDHILPAVFLLTILTVVTVWCGIAEAAFRAYSLYPLGTSLLTSARLLEVILCAAAVASDQNYVGVAAFMLAGRVFSAFIIVFICRKCCPDFKWMFVKPSRHRSHLIIKPGLAFLAFPLGNALTIQGTTLLIGGIFSPAFLAQFTAFRTLTRASFQLTTMVNRSLWPEISRLHGEGNFLKVKQLTLKSTKLLTTISAITAIAIYLFAPFILFHWTSGKIHFESNIFLFLSISTVIAGLWQSKMVALMATNAHEALGRYYLLASIASIAIIPITAPYLKEISIGLSVIAFDLIFTYFSHKEFTRNFKR